MGLDAYVRCRCIQDGLAKSHPFPEKFFLDDAAEPSLKGNPSSEEWAVHDRWFASSCEHGGYVLSERLGNIRMVAYVREFVHHLEGNPGPRFPTLLEQVVYDGTHSGDWLPSRQADELLAEIETILQLSDILSESEGNFFDALRRLCKASRETGNPIMF